MRVLGIIALLMTLVAPQVIRYLSDAWSETAAIQLKNRESAIATDLGMIFVRPQNNHGSAVRLGGVSLSLNDLSGGATYVPHPH